MSSDELKTTDEILAAARQEIYQRSARKFLTLVEENGADRSWLELIVAINRLRAIVARATAMREAEGTAVEFKPLPVKPDTQSEELQAWITKIGAKWPDHIIERLYECPTDALGIISCFSKHVEEAATEVELCVIDFEKLLSIVRNNERYCDAAVQFLVEFNSPRGFNSIILEFRSTVTIPLLEALHQIFTPMACLMSWTETASYGGHSMVSRAGFMPVPVDFSRQGLATFYSTMIDLYNNFQPQMKNYGELMSGLSGKIKSFLPGGDGSA